MDLEIKALRIFKRVMTDGSFSAAARSLKLTQPTISQQISKLESNLDCRLFERVGHDIAPTPIAFKLLELAESLLDRVDEFRESHMRAQGEPTGRVRYAMPESCQWTPHFRHIMRQIRELPRVSFEIDILDNEKIVEGLLFGRLDFGFVSGDRVAPDLRFERFSKEHYTAVAAHQNLLAPLKHKDFSDVRFVSYPGWEPFLMSWAKSQRLWGNIRRKVSPCVRIGTLAGAIHAVKEGAGIAVFPQQCVSQEIESRELIEYTPRSPAASPIYLAWKVGAKFPKRVEVTINLLKKLNRDLAAPNIKR